MKTQVNFNPKLGMFHVKISLNSWEIPGRTLYINRDCSFSSFLVDDEEGSFLPKREGEVERCELPLGHRYEMQYQLFMPRDKQWLYIQDDGIYLPHFGKDQPRIRETEFILPDDYVVLSSHQLLKVQHHNNLLRFQFSGSDAPLFSIAQYLGDRIFSGEIYLLQDAANLELLSRMLREAHDHLRAHLGSGVFPQPLRYIVLPTGEKPFVQGGSIFFPWPEEERGLRGFEDVLRTYIGLGWHVKAEEKSEFFRDGLNLYLTSRVLKELYSQREYEAFLGEHQERKEQVLGKGLHTLVGRDLSLASWLFFEDLESFLGENLMDQILKRFIDKHREKRTDLQHFYETFTSLSWKEGVGAFIEERLYGRRSE